MRTIRKAFAVSAATAASLVLFASSAAAKAGGDPAIPLSSGQETADVDSDGSGFFAYMIDDDQLCYTLRVRNMTDAPVAAHIHAAQRRVDGPIVVGLTTPPGATSTVDECLTADDDSELTPTELAAIAADPRSYYANVHTPTYPGGEVRGQLK